MNFNDLLINCSYKNEMEDLLKITNFTAQAEYITSRGFPEPVSIVMMVLAIALLISGTILLVLTERIKLACSLLLIFLIPATIIFHLVPFQLVAVARNLSVIGGLLIAIDKSK